MGGTRTEQPPHIPVLLSEVLEGLAPRSEGIYVDGTFGAGGHTRALLGAANCGVVAIDRDSSAEGFAAALKDEYGSRFTFVAGRFANMERLLHEQGINKVDGILLDIGVSSMQLDTSERGFSFLHDGPLDMRMEKNGQNAADIVNSLPERELADIIFRFGDERKSRKIAKAIVAARDAQPITRTRQLADIVREAVRSYNDAIHPATRTFQALRIWVNNELGELEEGLQAAENLLKPGGRLAVITFHSGEDMIVKRFMQKRAGKEETVSRYMPLPADAGKNITLKLVTRKAIAPSEEEIKRNPRARSAKLRVAERL